MKWTPASTRILNSTVLPNRQVVVVAGCSSGIGRAVAERLSRTCSVFGGSRRITHPTAWVYRPLDVTDAATVDAFMGWVLDKAGHIDVLIASAGVGLAGAVEDTDDDEALRQFDVNVLGTTRLIRAVLPPIAQAGSGKIIVVGRSAASSGCHSLPITPRPSSLLPDLLKRCGANFSPPASKQNGDSR